MSTAKDEALTFSAGENYRRGASKLDTTCQEEDVFFCSGGDQRNLTCTQDAIITGRRLIDTLMMLVVALVQDHHPAEREEDPAQDQEDQDQHVALVHQALVPLWI